MKKNLLLGIAILGLCSSLSAQTLTFYNGNEPVAPGGTVNFSDYEPFEYNGMVEAYLDPKISIMKDSEGPVTIKATSNYEVQLCIGGQCEAATEVVKDNLQFDANTLADLLLECSVFFASGEPIVIPDINVLIEAWYSNDPSKVTSMTLHMGGEAGLSSVETDTNVVYAENGLIRYNVTAPVKIDVYNTSGSKLLNRVVSGSGALSLSSLPSGLYIYRAEGAASASGKILVK